MTIVVGLGNPGEKFKNTRHNVGFMAVDFFAQQNNFPDFLLSKKYRSLISEQDGIILVKPQTFMNESGLATKKIMAQDKKAGLVVIHDDIDLPLGKIKFSKDSGSGGHKGVDSIINSLGSKDFVRLKIGIGRNGDKIKAEKIVLKKFTKEEKEVLKSAIEKSVEALSCLTKNGLEKTMNEYNG